VLEEWRVEEFNVDGMMIQAKFKNADQVSKGLDIDLLNLNFVWPIFFQTQKDAINLEMNYGLSIQLPLQMGSELEYENAVSEGGIVEFFSRFGIFICIFFILFSNVSSGLLFCAIELFQLLVLIAG